MDERRNFIKGPSTRKMDETTAAWSGVISAIKRCVDSQVGLTPGDYRVVVDVTKLGHDRSESLIYTYRTSITVGPQDEPRLVVSPSTRDRGSGPEVSESDSGQVRVPVPVDTGSDTAFVNGVRRYRPWTSRKDL